MIVVGRIATVAVLSMLFAPGARADVRCSRNLEQGVIVTRDSAGAE
jgi:hypothetical protein